MAITTESEKGLTIRYKTEEISALEILADIDLRTGTPVEETGWLSGNSGGSYPGTLAGFNANNADGNAVGGLRMVTISFTLATATVEVFEITEGASKIIGIVGCVGELADKTLTALFTNTGDGTADPPAKTGGSLPAVELHAEGAMSGTITLLMLGA